jgi:hypothetical protein
LSRVVVEAAEEPAEATADGLEEAGPELATAVIQVWLSGQNIAST